MQRWPRSVRGTRNVFHILTERFLTKKSDSSRLLPTFTDRVVSVEPMSSDFSYRAGDVVMSRYPLFYVAPKTHRVTTLQRTQGGIGRRELLRSLIRFNQTTSRMSQKSSSGHSTWATLSLPSSTPGRTSMNTLQFRYIYFPRK